MKNKSKATFMQKISNKVFGNFNFDGVVTTQDVMGDLNSTGEKSSRMQTVNHIVSGSDKSD